jgi:hypothetical protein
MIMNHEAMHERARIIFPRLNTAKKLLGLVKSLHRANHHPIRIEDERERLVTASPVMT